MKTNILTHINYVAEAGRQQEIRIIKLWRNQKPRSRVLKLLPQKPFTQLLRPSRKRVRRISAMRKKRRRVCESSTAQVPR